MSLEDDERRRVEREQFFKEMYDFQPDDGPVFRLVMRLIFWVPICLVVAGLVAASYWWKTAVVLN